MRGTTPAAASSDFRRYVPGSEEIESVLLMIVCLRLVLWLLEKVKLIEHRRAVFFFRVVLAVYVGICVVATLAGM